MWTASPCIPHTQFTTTTTNPAAMCLPITAPPPLTAVKPATNRRSTGAPTKFQLYSQLRDLDLNTGSTGVTENKQRQQRGAREEQVVEKRGGDSKKLSGFDVLRALEKASAQKMKKRRSGRDGSLLSSRKVVSGQGRKARAEEDEEELGDYGNKIVRPLSVKEDWGSRLDELETRLEELVDTAAV